MDAVVTDAEHRAAVAGLRALGEAGLRVAAVAGSRAAAGRWSRHCSARLPTPANPGELPATLAELPSSRSPAMVYSASEDSLEALLGRRDSLPAHVRLPYPPTAAVQAIRDKRALPQLAADAGLRAPQTIAVARAAELDRIVLVSAAVAKPATPAGGFRGAGVVCSTQELVEWARARRFPGDEPVLVQEPAEGPVLSVELVLRRDGSLAERFVQLGHRTWPADAGSISASTGVAPDEALVERAAGMLAAAGYWGLAQVDFIGTDDGPVVVDVNPRLYSCLPLSMASGVNLPAAWHAVALGRNVPGPSAYRPGISYRWLEGDLIAAVRGHPRRLLRRAAAPRTGAVWAADDPVASLLLGVGAFTQRVRRMAGRG